MAIRSIRRQSTNPLAAPGTPSTAPIYVDSDDNKLKMIPAGSGTTEVEVVDASSTQTLTNKTLTSPVVNNALISATAATLTIAAATHDNKTVVLNKAAGVAVTLPAATGTGLRVRFTIGTALSGGSHTIAVANATDYFRGAIIAVTDAANGSAPDAWATANTGTVSTESDTITLNGTTQGGNLGDTIEIEDIATAIWRVNGVVKASGAEATPFSAAV